MSECLTTNPIKLSQPAGAALAFMGVEGSVPLWHGVQGCAAFAKILFIQHFREPMPFQTTAMTSVSVVMGGGEELEEALDNVRKDAALIGLLTTGVAETSGADLGLMVKEYGRKNPGATIVHVNTPDYEGSLQTGWTRACEAALEKLAEPRSAPRKKQVAIFPGPYFTPAEIEMARESVELFGLRPAVFPDLGSSLLGFATDKEHNPATIGGTPVDEIRTLADSAMVITLGRSMKEAGRRFAEENGVDSAHFDSLSTLDEIDGFYGLLSRMSGAPVPERIRRHRRHLQDVILDTHFYLTGERAIVAGDPEFIIRWKKPLEGIGAEVSAVCSIPADGFPEGGLEDVERAVGGGPDVILAGNSHVAEFAERLGAPAVRAGLPVYDRIGEPQKIRAGYRGAAWLYMELANAVMAARKKTAPYVSNLQKTLR